MPRLTRALLPPLCLLLAIFLVFGRTLTGQFVQWDDPDMTWQNPHLNPPSLANLAHFWSRPEIHLYTPLAYTAWSAVAAIDGQPPGPALFHLLNLLLHAGAAIFAYLLLKELVEAKWAAWIGAMIFALHPLQVEPVAWVAGMNNLLCGMFSLAALWQFVRFIKADKTSHLHLALATLFYAVALLSKPIAIVVPLLAAALEFWAIPKPTARRSTRSRALPILLWLLMAAPIALITRLAQPSTSIFAPPLWDRPLIAVDALGFYAQKLFIPFHMAIDYQRTPRWLLDNFWFAWPGFLTVFLAVFLAVIAWLAAPRRWRAPLAIVPLALLPVLGLTPFDFQNYSTVADRYMYLPMLGVSLAAACAMERAGTRLIPWTLAALALVLLAARSFDQTKVWHDTETLANQQFTLDPASATGHKILGSWLSLQGRDQEAETHLKLAIDVLTDDPAADGVPWYNYGNLLIAERRYSEAIVQFQSAIPRLSGAGLAQAYINLGVALIRTGEVDRAKESFKNALKIQPDNPDARDNLNILEGK